MSKPLLSIVIPTHNRAKYAYDAILSILEINDDRLELVVSDTSTNSALKEILSGLDLAAYKVKLNYFNPVEPLDMTGNHNSAVSAAVGKYLCLIGDDDTITNELIDAAEWADRNNIYCLSPNITANYAWPDFRSRLVGSGHAGRLYLPKTIGNLQSVSSSVALKNSLSIAAQGTDGLPKLYHGLVKRSILDEIKDRSGAYFHGSSPDVSIAIGLAFLLSEKKLDFYTIDYPLTIPGASGGSNTGRSAMNKHKGKLDSESQTSSFLSKGWFDGVPKYFSVETVWAHACLSTLEAFSDSDSLSAFNYFYLIATCLNLHKEFTSENFVAIKAVCAMPSYSEDEVNKKIQEYQFKLKYRRWKYVIRRALWPTASGGRAYVGNLSSIIDTQLELKKWLLKRRIDFDAILKE